MKIAPAKKRLLVYASIIGACAVGSIAFFTSSQYARAKYVSSKAQLQGAEKELANLKEEQAKMYSKWQSEKTELENVKTYKEQLETARLQLTQAQNDADYEKAAKLKYDTIIL